MKSVGTEILLYFVTILLTFKIFFLGPHNYTEIHQVHSEVQRENFEDLREPEDYQDST